MTNLIDERERTHGDFSQTAITAQIIKTELASATGCDDVQREALDMIASKLSRIANGDPNEPDHWRDIAGYAELVVRHLRRSALARLADDVRAAP